MSEITPANPNDSLDAVMDHEVIIFTKSNCVQCDQTKRLLHKKGVSFHEMSLEDETIRLTDQRYKTAYEFVTQTLGAQAAPVVLAKRSRLEKPLDVSIYTDFSYWSGFRPDFIKVIASDNQA